MSRRTVSLATIFISLSPATWAQGVILTFAGGGVSDPGDGGPGVSAVLFSPGGLAVDAAGNLYIADSGDNRIRKLTPGGMITTVAGTGGEGFSGDGGPATAALLQTPSDVAVDSTGNLYIADTANHRIRKVNAAGVITTTTGFFVAPQAVAVDAAGNVFVGDSIYLKQISADGTISTLLTSSVAIQCLTVDSQGDVLFGESDSSVGSHPRVRKRAPDGTVTTIAGTGATGYSGDGGPATAAMLFFSGRVDIGP